MKKFFMSNISIILTPRKASDALYLENRQAISPTCCRRCQGIAVQCPIEIYCLSI